MKNNQELQTDVQNAIQWRPSLNATEIGVTAKDDVVSLTGFVDNYAEIRSRKCCQKSGWGENFGSKY
jgi:osmotically-inducible protein OsmY